MGQSIELTVLRNHLIGDLYVDNRPNLIIDPHKKILLREATPEKIRMVAMHCTDAEGWSPERLASFHVFERGFPTCGYHYYVTVEKIYHMVGENIITYHAAPFNSRSVAFSIDYYATRDDKLKIRIRQELLENSARLGAYLCLKYKVSPPKTMFALGDAGFYGHRELPGTGFFRDKNDEIRLRKTCPGMAVDLDLMRYSVTKKIQEAVNQILNEKKLIVDGVYGPQTRKYAMSLDFVE